MPGVEGGGSETRPGVRALLLPSHTHCSLCLAQEALSGPNCSPRRAPNILGSGLAPPRRR